MKRLITFLILLSSSIAAGTVSLRICEADGITPFDGRQIMVGTKLTIYVDSNSAAADWGGEIDLLKPVPEPISPIGRLFGRESQPFDYPGSHFPAAGDRANVVSQDTQDQQIFELSAAGPNEVPGTWFVVDYNAMSVGDCTIRLVEYQGQQIVPIVSQTFHHIVNRDFNHDGKVNFADFARLASYWFRTDCGGINNCEGTDLSSDGRINFVDVMYFAEYWLGEKSQTDGALAGAPSQQSLATGLSVSDFATTGISLESDSMLITEQAQSPGIYLTVSNNTPHPGDEVTVYVYSQAPLFIMDIWAMVVGESNLTAAMSIADCNQYGWDPGWQMDSYIDKEGWVGIGGVAWPDQTSGTVGYFKFRYYGGQVTISILDELSDAFDNNSQAVLFSAEPLVIGHNH